MTKEEVIDLIRDAGYATLATTDENQPRVRPMMPYLTEDGRLLLALLPRSRTIRQVEKNPLVEVCFVDRKMWYCRVAGKAAISENTADKEILWNNIPMLRQYFGGIEDPNFKLMIIEIQETEAMMPHSRDPEKIDLSAV